MKNDTLIDINIAGDMYLADRDIRLDEKLVEIFEKSDLNIINLEGGFCRTNKKLQKAGPHLFQRETVIDVLKKLNCKLVTLANNHIMDGDIDNLNHTISCLNVNFINTIGAGETIGQAYQAYVYEKNRIKIGIINAAEAGFGCWDNYSKYGYAWIFHEKIELEIERLHNEEKCDIIIGIFHAGIEEVHYPLPEWRKIYQKYIDMGLDLIVAHHPHVSQGMEYYHDKPIFYSIGNFLWGGRNSEDESKKDTFGILAKICVNESKKINVAMEFLDTKGNILQGQAKELALKALEEWSAILRQENFAEYEKKINKECIRLFEEFYEKMIFASTGILHDANAMIGRRIKEYCLNIKNAILRQYRINKLALQHNMGIESHRWCCMRAMSRLK